MLVRSASGKPHMLPPVHPPHTLHTHLTVPEMLVERCVLVSEWTRGVVGGVGICLIPLSAGSSDRQLLPHLLPCWIGAC